VSLQSLSSRVSGRPRGLPALVGLSGPWGSECSCLFAEVVCSSSSSVAGRSAFPASSSTFPVSRGPRGLPSAVVGWSPTVRPSPSLPPLQCPRLVRAGRASHPLSRFTAPPSTSLRASTPGADPKIASIGPRLPHRKSRSVLVVSHHLDGLLRSELAGLLHPAVDPGVRRVSGPSSPAPRRRSSSWRAGDLPRDAHTPENFSSLTAAPRHRGRCLLAVHSPARSAFSGAALGTRRSRLARSHALRSRRCRRFGGIARDVRLRDLAPSTSL
jgi:hypothetical protein